MSIPVQETLQPSQHTAEEIWPGPASILVNEKTIHSQHTAEKIWPGPASFPVIEETIPSQHTTEEILSDTLIFSPIEETRKPQRSMITPFIGSYESSDHVLAHTHTESYETTYYVSTFTHLYQAQEEIEFHREHLIENSRSASYHTAEEFILESMTIEALDLL